MRAQDPILNAHRCLVILPTYNERDNVAVLIRKILAASDDVDVLVVDDSSPDGTADAIRAMQVETPRIHLIQRPGKLGLGSAYLIGFKTAVQWGFGSTCTMDADQSHDPAHLAGMLNLLKDHDLVIGSRYVPGGAVENWNILRKINSGAANLLARRIVGRDVRDCTSGYRLYSTRLIQQLELLALKSSGYSMLVELLYEARVCRARVVESPIVFRNRTLGKSKISYLEVLGSLRTLFRLKIRQIRGRHRFDREAYLPADL
jgi:dolichol-phosphate mannosyltransferase